MREVHSCLLCHGEGEGGREGRGLSFAPDKIHNTRYHYSCCLYNSDVYPDMYKPHPENINEDGSLNDELGRVYKYNCEYCSDKKGKRNRDMGYKEYVIHMACHHGGLEILLSASYDYEVRALAVKLGDVACKLEKL